MKKTCAISTEDLVKMVDLLEDIGMSAKMFKNAKTEGGYRVFLCDEDMQTIKTLLGKYKHVSIQSMRDFLDKNFWFLNLRDPRDRKLEIEYYDAISKAYPLFGDVLLKRKLTEERRKVLESEYKKGTALYEKYCERATRKYEAYVKAWLLKKKVKFAYEKGVFAIKNKNVKSIWVGNKRYMEPTSVHATVPMERFKKDMVVLTNSASKVSFSTQVGEEVWLERKVFSTGDAALFLTVLFNPKRVSNPYILPC
jgi:hypothetical protein